MRYLLVAIFALGLVYCNKGSNNNPAPPPTYTMNNGACYDNSGQVVNSSYCVGQPGYNGYPGYGNQTGGYYMSNGQCYSPQGQPVSNTACSGYGGQTGPCVGTYYYCFPSGECIQGNCNGTNCNGYLLYNANRQPVQC